MHKAFKILLITIVAIVGVSISIYGLAKYRNYIFEKIAVSYIEEKYGIETTPIDSCRLQRLPYTKWDKDILLRSNNSPDLNIWVRLNYDGTVYSDDYYYYILENKLSDEYGSILNKTWDNISKVSAKIFFFYEHLELFGGENTNSMNVDLGEELLNVMDREMENVTIQDVKDILPEHSLDLVLDYDKINVDIDDECNKIFEIISYFKNSDYAPNNFYVEYFYENENIKNVLVTDFEDINSPEDLKQCFNRQSWNDKLKFIPLKVAL